MSIIFLILLSTSTSTFYCASAEETAVNLTCPEFKNIVIGSFFYALSSNQAYKAADFYIATEDSVDGMKIGENDWSVLESKAFNLSRKTYIIIHGYRAHYKKDWIKELKEKLLLTNDINLFVLDWSSVSWNYVNAVQRTYLVAKDIVKFLQDMKTKVAKLSTPKHVLWNHLYFIGHSLGAHISGQAGRLLRETDSFFKVERITGLDPAQPCFIQTDYSMKLDKTDADFVDIIHTQTGNGNSISGLGLREPIGHIDFYVNGGALQPECEKEASFYTARIQKMICSHDLAITFYTESLNKSDSEHCKFIGHSWDGTYDNALKILNKIDEHTYFTCSDCPEMGINAINYRKNSGKYLVILPLKKPYCQAEYSQKDKTLLQKVFEELKAKPVPFHDNTYNPEDLFDKWTV